MKYYAIRNLDGRNTSMLFTDWNACKGVVTGHHAEYKSFKTEQEAYDYLGSYKAEENEQDVLQSENNIFYVDGSYLNDKIGWGFIHVLHNEEQTRMCGGIEPNENTSRNITGELEASKMAVRYAIANRMKKIYIVNDYQGISSYVTGSWKPKTQESKDYTEFMNKAKNKVDINFIKVKGHSNNKFNDMVDELAKQGTIL